MREPIRDLPRVEHILEAIDNALSYTAEVSKEQLLSDKILLHATIYNIQIIGEAVNKLTSGFKERHAQIPWRQIEKMRHILVHDYYKVNFDFVWLVLQDDLHPLRENLLAILEEEKKPSAHSDSAL